jgi:ribosomal protein L15E
MPICRDMQKAAWSVVRQARHARAHGIGGLGDSGSVIVRIRLAAGASALERPIRTAKPRVDDVRGA